MITFQCRDGNDSAVVLVTKIDSVSVYISELMFFSAVGIDLFLVHASKLTRFLSRGIEIDLII